MPGKERSGTPQASTRPRWEALRLGARRPRRVRVCFHTHALADYLFHGLYRTDRLGLDVPVELSEIPEADCLGHFPQYVARCGAQSPEELPRLVEEYYGEDLARYDMPLAGLRPRIAALAPHFEAYLPFWHDRILPLESQMLDAWRDQAGAGEAMELFQRVTRLRWPFAEVHLYACYHHPSGSALTPYPCLFSTLFDPYGVEPSVAWFLGHEATHLLLDAVAWWEHADAPAAIRWAGSRHMAEEALCLVVQNRLATLCGLLPESEMQILRGSARHLQAYRWLQEHWEEYLLDPERYPTLVEYFLSGLREAGECRRRAGHGHESVTAAARAA